MNKKTSHWARWGFMIFGGLLIIINASLTFAFGYSYLGAAFGQGIIANYAGAFYTLLLFDAGYLAWFYTFLRAAESTSQRSLSLGMTIFSLIGSLAATLQQLATNATALVDLTSYHQVVGIIALGSMLFMTASHIIATAAYLLLDPRERVKQVMASARATALDDSLAVAEKMIALDHKEMIDIMSANVRTDILASLGFTADLQHLTSQGALPATTGGAQAGGQKETMIDAAFADSQPAGAPEARGGGQREKGGDSGGVGTALEKGAEGGGETIYRNEAVNQGVRDGGAGNDSRPVTTHQNGQGAAAKKL